MYYCSKKRETAMSLKWEHPTGNHPNTVAIVALGGSRIDYDELRLAKREHPIDIDEVWTVNRGARLWSHDLAFVMDDHRREAAEDPQYGEYLKRPEAPIITSVSYPEFDEAMIHELPLVEMAAWTREINARPYWTNSIPLMIAYALFIGAERILIHGADYTLPNGQVMEQSRPCVEYWIAVGDLLGRQVGISQRCRLLGNHDFAPGYVYGYDLQWHARSLVQAGLSQGESAEEEPKPKESAVQDKVELCPKCNGFRNTHYGWCPDSVHNRSSGPSE